MTNEILLRNCAAEMNIELTEGMTASFMQYMQMLLEWNEKINLTAITDPREIVLKHFADSLTALSELEAKAALRVADIGTGAGFPGLPLAIAAPAWEVSLMDSLQKRVKFLQHVTTALGIEKTSCLHTRAEDAGQASAHRERYDAVVSRAVARLAVLSEYALPLVKVGGTFLALKGPAAEEEVKEALPAIQKLGGELVEIKDAKIPFTELYHKLVIVRKKRHTPTGFPRNAAQMAKAPLK